MGLDFSKTTAPAMPETVADGKNEIEVVQQYDIVADREQMNAELVGSKEVDALTSTIEVSNLETIVSFGAEVAEEISKASDVVLNSMSMSQIDDSSQMLNTLAKIMTSLILMRYRKIRGDLKSCLEICVSSWKRYWINIIRWETR